MTKNTLYVFGIVLIILGLLGFINNPIFGLFRVDALHNIIHLASGILAIVFASMGEQQSRTFSVVFGVVYALVTVLGFINVGVSGTGHLIGSLIAINGNDNFLHLLFAIVLLALGLRKPVIATAA